MQELIIRQIKKESLQNGKSFLPYSWIIEKFGQIDTNDYEIVYASERKDEYDFEDAFYEFNVNHPEDYKGRSMSVSDIVTIGDTTLYCDSLGWHSIQNLNF